MSDNKYTTFKITTRYDGSIENLDFSSYAPDNDAVSAMMQPIIDAVATTAKEELQQRQQSREQGRELFSAMMKESAKESAQDKAVDTAESAEREAEAEADKAAEMTGSDETEAEKAIDVLAKRMKPEKVVAMIKRFVNAIS